MISINLLPDIKQEYLRSQKVKRVFIAGSILVTAAVLTVVVLFAIYVFAGQRAHIKSVQNDIDSSIIELKSIEDIEKIVSIQKQLEVLPGLHDNKPAVGRFFNDYLPKLVPSEVAINSIEIRITDYYEMEIKGEATNFKAVNTFADTLKFADLIDLNNSDSVSVKPFTNVVVDSYSVDDEVTSYSIKLVFDPALFDATFNLSLKVPEIFSSPSVTERPGALFQLPKDVDEEAEGQQQ